MTTMRFVVLLISSLIALQGSKQVSLTSAGPLGNDQFFAIYKNTYTHTIFIIILAVLTLSIVAKSVWSQVDYQSHVNLHPNMNEATIEKEIVFVHK